MEGMNWSDNPNLQKLLKMRSMAFTVEELKYLIKLEKPYHIGFERNVDRIYNRVKNLPMEQGGLEGGYQF